jgi:hypothetical protein
VKPGRKTRAELEAEVARYRTALEEIADATSDEGYAATRAINPSWEPGDVYPYQVGRAFAIACIAIDRSVRSRKARGAA